MYYDDDDAKEFGELVLATLVSGGILAGILAGAKLSKDHYEKTNTEQAIIYGDGTATILDVASTDTYNQKTIIKTKNGMEITVPTNTVQIVDLEDSEYTAEDFAIYTMGEDVEIHYLFDAEEETLTETEEQSLTLK